MLFAKHPQRKFSQATIHAGAFKADGAVIYDTNDSMGNVQDQVEDALGFIKKSIRCAIVVTGKAEHDRYWEYPVEVIREALANAVCHRDYSIGKCANEDGFGKCWFDLTAYHSHLTDN